MSRCRCLVFCDKNDVYWIWIFCLRVGWWSGLSGLPGTCIHLLCLFPSSAYFITDMWLCGWRSYCLSTRTLHKSTQSHILSCLQTWLCTLCSPGNYLQYPLGKLTEGTTVDDNIAFLFILTRVDATPFLSHPSSLLAFWVTIFQRASWEMCPSLCHWAEQLQNCM